MHIRANLLMLELAFLFFSSLLFWFLNISLLIGFHTKNSLYENNVVQEDAKTSLGKGLSINKEKYNLTEMIFNMERGGCACAEASLENAKQNPKPGEKGKAQSGRETTSPGSGKDAAAAAKKCPPPDTGKTGLAPWQEGVLERLREELSPQEYNMYVVHHGRMLLAFGQIEACTPREKDFVYGSLEPIPVQSLHSFKVMITSYIYTEGVSMLQSKWLLDTILIISTQPVCVHVQSRER